MRNTGSRSSISRGRPTKLGCPVIELSSDLDESVEAALHQLFSSNEE
jgi:hypothetical protein